MALVDFGSACNISSSRRSAWRRRDSPLQSLQLGRRGPAITLFFHAGSIEKRFFGTDTG
jgi:hypothetical protein